MPEFDERYDEHQDESDADEDRREEIRRGLTETFHTKYQEMMDTLKAQAQRLERLQEDARILEPQVAAASGELIPPNIESLVTQAMQTEHGGE